MASKADEAARVSWGHGRGAFVRSKGGSGPHHLHSASGILQPGGAMSYLGLWNPPVLRPWKEVANTSHKFCRYHMEQPEREEETLK